MPPPGERSACPPEGVLEALPGPALQDRFHLDSLLVPAVPCPVSVWNPKALPQVCKASGAGGRGVGRLAPCPEVLLVRGWGAVSGFLRAQPEEGTPLSCWGLALPGQPALAWGALQEQSLGKPPSPPPLLSPLRTLYLFQRCQTQPGKYRMPVQFGFQINSFLA